MTTTGNATVTRTVSRDGTEIGYWTSGEGPPLVLVHGGLGDHMRWDTLRPHLEPHATVHAMDRRGRGASGDAPDYVVTREFEDVAAVIDSVAEASGSKVNLYANSFGGLCALGAATLTSSINKLALYEAWPPVPEALTPPLAVVEGIEALLAEDKREAALEAAYRNLLQVTEEQLADLRAQPAWPARVAAIHTLPRELRTVPEMAFDPGRVASITAPTLLMVGTESPDWKPEAMKAVLPDARIAVLDGHGHMADLLAPEVVAAHLVPFLRDQR